MLGLTNLGIVHTLISIVAVIAALTCFFRYGGISLRNRAGQVYVWTTVLTCLTGFFIFEHGGFGKPHALGIVTLLVLAVAYAAEKRRAFGAVSPYVEAVSYSATAFFHTIPAVAEGGTRLPPGGPWFDNPEAPQLLAISGAFFLIFLIGAAYQVWRLRGQRMVAPVPGKATA